MRHTNAIGRIDNDEGFRTCDYSAEVSYYDEYTPDWAFVQDYFFGSGTGHHLPIGFVQFLDRNLLTNLQIVERMNEALKLKLCRRMQAFIMVKRLS